ncbi:glycosyltransferase 61 family protein [Nocardioides sp. 503]|uniref:glycosyltransferase family 61 protein n=1 Tax=Nocardioides sp. 503 TaxID=2508326 RepID=UPI00106F9241|nr:glycosyltransferase 61 family protein [Nocardioides sp. 503]
MSARPVSGLVRRAAQVPGLGRAVAGARRVRAGLRTRFPHRRYRELAGLVAAARDRDDATIAVLGPADPRLVAAVRAGSPRASVTEVVTGGSERHVAMAAAGPYDVILDRVVPEGRRDRFEATFFHLRPEGTYVVPDGAPELGDHPGPLGQLLDPSGPVPRGPRKDKLRLADFRLSLDKHVTRRVVAADLLLSHDLPDVYVKLREGELDTYLGLAPTPHRLLRTIPAEPPPPAPAGREGPDPRDPPMHRPINEATISLRDYRDVVVFPRQMMVWDRLLLPETFRHNQWPVLEHTQLVDHGPLFARRRTPLQEEPPVLAGTYLHLDNEFRGHFGHLLTESLSRVWSWPLALELDPEARVLVGTTKKRPRPLEYELELYEACGIPRDRVVVADGPVRVERLISGTPMFSHPEYVHPAIAQTWREVGDRLADGAEDQDWPRRFFVSRRTDKRSCTNGAEVEAIFAEYGFQPVYPEDYSLGEQVRLFRAAEVIAGYAGSGLFQMAFVTEPTHVIMVGAASYTMRNEYLMAAVHGHRLDGVFSRVPGKKVQVSYTFDHEREGPFLRAILDELP